MNLGYVWLCVCQAMTSHCDLLWFELNATKTWSKNAIKWSHECNKHLLHHGVFVCLREQKVRWENFVQKKRITSIFVGKSTTTICYFGLKDSCLFPSIWCQLKGMLISHQFALQWKWQRDPIIIVKEKIYTFIHEFRRIASNQGIESVTAHDSIYLASVFFVTWHFSPLE